MARFVESTVRRGVSGARHTLFVGMAVLGALAATAILPDVAEAKKGKRRDDGPQTSFSGTVVGQRLGKHGNISTVILSSGQALHFPRHEAARAASLRMGQQVSGAGYWTHKKEGRVISPTSLNRSAALSR